MNKQQVFIPGMIDTIPIRTRDDETGKEYVRIISCLPPALELIASDPNQIFKERLYEGEIAVDIAGRTYFVDVKETSDNVQRQRPSKSKDYLSKLCWVKRKTTFPAMVLFSAATPKELKDKFVYESDDIVNICRPEEWYGVKEGAVIYEESKQCINHRIAFSLLREIATEKSVCEAWRLQLEEAMMDARSTILDENFYTRPISTVLAHMPERRQASPETEAMVYKHWRYAVGYDREPVSKHEGNVDVPDRFFYFAAFAALFGPHIHAMPKQMPGPGKIMVFDHWLPLMSAQMTEWFNNKYTPNTRAAFYRYVNNSPFSMKYLVSISSGLYLAGQIQDQGIFVASVRNELYTQWKEQHVTGLGTDDVDVKAAVREVLLLAKQVGI